MKRKIVIIFIVFICISTIIVLHRYWNVSDMFNGGNFGKAENLSIEQIIKKSIRIQYLGGNTKEMNRIFTKDFIKQIETEHGFYQKYLIHTIDKNFMKSFRRTSENQAMVYVTVNDLADEYYQEITLTKDKDGNWQVSKIALDT